MVLVAVSAEGVHECDIQATALHGHQDAITGVDISPDGMLVATGGADGTVRLWDVKRSEQAMVLEERDSDGTRVVFSPDGRMLAVGFSDGTICIWDVSSKAKIHNIQAHGEVVTSIAWSPDRKLLVSSGWDCKVKFWDSRSGRMLRCVPDDEESSRWLVTDIAFSHKGEYIALSGSGGVRLWEGDASGRQRVVLPANTTATAFSPDDGLLAYSDAKNDVRVWDICLSRRTGNLPCDLAMVSNLVFSDDGAMLYGVGDRSFKAWEIQPARVVSESPIDSLPRPRCFWLSPDHRIVMVTPNGVLARRDSRFPFQEVCRSQLFVSTKARCSDVNFARNIVAIGSRDGMLLLIRWK